MNFIKQGFRGLARAAGFDVVRYSPDSVDPLGDLRPEDKATVAAVRPFTMTPIERIAVLIETTRYLATNGIEGAIVECGVWRGGSIMAALRTLVAAGDTAREVYLYDTFEGMPAPGDQDKSYDGVPAANHMRQPGQAVGQWCYASFDDVKANVLSTGYPEARIHFVRGKVEETLPATLPASIALLRLDTDWYESTRHELKHLFPLLHPKGVLILDDYGHWMGVRKAVDEFFEDRRGQYFFSRIDCSSRLVIRTAS